MSKFFKDLEFGHFYENELIKIKGWKSAQKKSGVFSDYDILDDEGIKWEVKCDRNAKKTGNVCIEFMYKGFLSGIETTKSNYYAYFIVEDEGYTLYQIPTDDIKELIITLKPRILFGGDNKKSKFYLINRTHFEKYKV